MAHIGTKVKTFLINSDSYISAKAALRDILFMYYSTDNYEGFGPGLDCGDFDPSKFLCVEISEPGFLSVQEASLLQEGSAVKILSRISDEYDEYGKLSDSTLKFIDSIISNEALVHLPEAHRAIASALSSYDGFQSELERVYRAYVQTLFKRLAAN